VLTGAKYGFIVLFCELDRILSQEWRGDNSIKTGAARLEAGSERNKQRQKCTADL